MYEFAVLWRKRHWPSDARLLRVGELLRWTCRQAKQVYAFGGKVLLPAQHDQHHRGGDAMSARLEYPYPFVGRLLDLGDQRRIADDRWRSFFLWGFGYKVEANARRCPQTAEILSQMPDLVTAFFSILEPGVHIPRHRGVSKRIINFHLALKVPSGVGDCRIAVDDQIVRWQEGKCIVFDDTYFHEVWNDTQERRVVLLLQFKRPIRQPGKFLGDLFLALVRLSPYVQEARRNIAAWENAQQQMEKS